MMDALTRRLRSSFRGDGLKAQLVRGAFGVGGLQAISLPLTLASSILLARGLGPEGYGQYTFVLSVITLCALPVSSGLRQLISREVARYHHGEMWGFLRGLLRCAHAWVFLVALLIAIGIMGLAACYGSWTWHDRWTLLLLTTPMLPLLGLQHLRTATLRGLRHVIYAKLPELLIRPGIHLIIAACLIFSDLLSPATALAGQIAATAMGFGVGTICLLSRKPHQITKVHPGYEGRAWARALVPFTLLAAVSAFNGQIGILVLGWLGTNEDIAALRVAMRAAMIVAMSLTIVNHVIAPHITQAHQENDKSTLQNLSRQSARTALVVALPVALPLIFFGGPIIQLIYGDDYVAPATLPLAILTIGQLVNVTFGSVGMFLTMTGFERDTLLGQVIALLVTVFGAIALIPPLGALGAAIAVTLGLITWNTVLAIRFVQRLGLKPTAF